MRVPVFRTIYAPVKQLVVAFSPDNEYGFKRVVIVEDAARGLVLGFLTKEFTLDRGSGPEEMLAVYVPTNHLYLGDVIICTPAQVLFPEISVEQGIRIFLTGGMALPGRMRSRPFPGRRGRERLRLPRLKSAGGQTTGRRKCGVSPGETRRDCCCAWPRRDGTMRAFRPETDARLSPAACSARRDSTNLSEEGRTMFDKLCSRPARAVALACVLIAGILAPVAALAQPPAPTVPAAQAAPRARRGRSQPGPARPQHRRLPRHQRPDAALGGLVVCVLRPRLRPGHLHAAEEPAGPQVDAGDLRADLRDLQDLPDHAGQVHPDPRAVHRRDHGVLLRRAAAHATR